MVKICVICFDNESWRYHNETFSSPLTKFVAEISKTHFNILLQDSIQLCHSCYGVLSRFYTYTQQVQTRRLTYPRNESVDATGDSNTRTSDNSEKSSNSSYENKRTDDVKKYLISSEHNYTCQKRRLVEEDHEYVCHLQSEEISEDEEEDEEVEDLKMMMFKLLPPPQESLQYQSPSILKNTSVQDLTNKNVFLEVLQEMKRRCPELLQLMTDAAIDKYSSLTVTMRQIMSIVTSYSVLMFARCNRNSAIQRMITLLAVKGNASDELIKQLNQISVTVSCTQKIYILDKAVETSERLTVNSIKSNPAVKITGDNLDMFVRTNHQRVDNGNQDIHWFASNLVISRIDQSGLSQEIPKVQYQDINPAMFVPSEAERKHLIDVKKALIGRLLTEKKDFQWLKGLLPKQIPHRERLQNMKNICHLAITPEGKFQHLHPIVCEWWHMKQDLLAKAYKALYKTESLEQRGTLFHCKIILRRADVTGNVKSNFKAHEQLLLLVVQALIHVASESIEDPENMGRDYVLTDIYKRINGEMYGNDDHLLNYCTNLLTWGLQIINLNDTAKEGDIDRLVMNAKENIPFFYGHSKFSKYFAESVNTILQTEYLLSPMLRMRMLEGAFLNLKGRPGQYKEADLVQENCIKNKKELIRSLGANKTERAVQRACGAADTCFAVSENFSRQIGLGTLSGHHTKKSSSKDLQILVKTFRELEPFIYHSGRQLKNFEALPKDPRSMVSQKEIIEAIKRKTRSLFIYK